MGSVYTFLAGLDFYWYLTVFIVILVLDVFFLNTTVLLIFAGVSLLTGFFSLFGASGEVLAWSIPLQLIFFFLAQRNLLAQTYVQSSPYEETAPRQLSGIVIEDKSDASAHNYFYGYKDEKQMNFAEVPTTPRQVLKFKADNGDIYDINSDHNIYSVGNRVVARKLTEKSVEIIE